MGRIAYYNSNDGNALLMMGSENELRINTIPAINLIDRFISENQGEFIALAISYDLKNEIEQLNSNNKDKLSFPVAALWTPETVVKIGINGIEFLKGGDSDELRHLVHELMKEEYAGEDIRFLEQITREDYLQNAQELKRHIRLGNVYEVNYCQQYLAELSKDVDAIAVYRCLNHVTESPFSTYLKFDEFDVICGSPERFLQKQGKKLISEPIKGTIQRGTNVKEDEAFKQRLVSDPKERSENVMIVDLVRNDLSKIAKRGSVEVEELFGIYSFKTVHQMISRIVCEVRDEITFGEVLRALFPMGSMTGAPKMSAMELIDSHESFARGIYSGTIGYIDPSGDFDLNVVIRSIIYNRQEKIMSCSVGGALTINADPEKEYEECKVKVGKILSAFNGKH